MTTSAIFNMSLALLTRSIRRWWLGHIERHSLMAAEVEAERAKEHQANVAYYQRKAAMARSERLSG